MRSKLKPDALAFPPAKAFLPNRQLGFSPSPRNQTGTWLAIHLPLLALEVLAGGPEISAPFAVIGEKPKCCLLACNKRAEDKGLRGGMTLSAAFALVSDLHVKERDEVAEKSAIEALAGWAAQFTSLVSLAPPQALLLEVGGSERLFGGVQPLTEVIEQGLTQLGYGARIAVAPTPLAALLLSRAGAGTRSQPRSMTGDLAGVSLQDSGLETKVVEQLRTLGLRTFADCYRLPRDGLARRVGPQVVAFLDKVLGKAADPRIPFVIPKRFERCLSFPDEVETLEVLLFALRRLLLELTGMLRAGDAGIQELEITLLHRKHPPTRVDVGLLSASRDERHLQSLIKERLDRITLTSPVEHIQIKTGKILPLAPDDLDFFDTSTRSSEDWPRLVEKLRARLGRGAVYGLNTLDEYRPERAWRIGGLGKLGAGKKVIGSHPWRDTDDTFSHLLKSRPIWLLPEPLLLRTKNHRPQFRGPLRLPRPRERIESGWWDGNDVSRDYFVALNEAGEHFWIFRDRRSPTTWYMHGIFA